MNSTQNRKTDIETILGELESSIWDGDGVEFIYMQLDEIASVFRNEFPDLVPADEETTPDVVFEKLQPSGLHADASGYCSRLEELSSQKWYDDGRESEEADLSEAEECRERLHELLIEFCLKLGWI